MCAEELAQDSVGFGAGQDRRLAHAEQQALVALGASGLIELESADGRWWRQLLEQRAVKRAFRLGRRARKHVTRKHVPHHTEHLGVGRLPVGAWP